MAESESTHSAIAGFFERAGLGLKDMVECEVFLEKLFPGLVKEPVPHQGFCSYTVYLGNDQVVQFRPDNYQLDLTIIEYALEVLGSWVPMTRQVGKTTHLHAYIMAKLPGISFGDFRAREMSFPTTQDNRKRICEDFALLMARSWQCCRKASFPKGVVGSSLKERLQMLSTRLPVRLRPVAKLLLSQLHLIESLRWVVTHGDLVAGNIMLDSRSGHLSGLVDWAEAEVLPFGISLYGLEELIGQMTPDGFIYCSNAIELRGIFWKSLVGKVPELKHHLATISMARNLGILLWHGIAFDDGKIDRVVQEGRDDAEIAYLDAFLNLSTEHEVERATPKIESVHGKLEVVAA